MSRGNDAQNGIWPRALRILEASLKGKLEDHEVRLQGLEELTANELVAWRGNERRQGGSVFSDQQTDKVKALVDERAEVHAGRLFFRLLLWLGGTAGITASAILLAYLKLKG